MLDPTSEKYSSKANAREKEHHQNGKEVFFCDVLLARDGQREKKRHAIGLIIHGDGDEAEKRAHKSQVAQDEIIAVAHCKAEGKTNDENQAEKTFLQQQIAEIFKKQSFH